MSAESLLRGFKLFPAVEVNVGYIVPYIETFPQTREEFDREYLGPMLDIRPLLTRFNGDGTWRVVQDGKTIATGFDTERDAREWKP